MFVTAVNTDTIMCMHHYLEQLTATQTDNHLTQWQQLLLITMIASAIATMTETNRTTFTY